MVLNLTYWAISREDGEAQWAPEKITWADSKPNYIGTESDLLGNFPEDGEAQWAPDKITWAHSKPNYIGTESDLLGHVS